MKWGSTLLRMSSVFSRWHTIYICPPPPHPPKKKQKKNVTTLGYFLILFDLACSKRSDSGERCEVKKAMKSRGGLVFIFSRSFLVRTASHYLNAWNRLSLTRSHWDCWLLIDKMVFPGKPYFVVALWVPDVGKGGVCVGGGGAVGALSVMTVVWRLSPQGVDRIDFKP